MAEDHHPHLAATPWPAEDGGPRRLARPVGLAGPAAQSAALAVSVLSPITVMALQAPGGRLLVLRNTVGADGVSWVAELDPLTLDEIGRSEDLPLGPFWPGGMAVLGDGSVVVAQGRYVHRLGSDLVRQASRRMDVEAPHNSFVVLADGSVATKDLQFPDGVASTLSILDPVTLADRCAPLVLPEPSVARLAADGNDVIVVGVDAMYRVRWSPGTGLLEVVGDALTYRTRSDQSYGWDPVVGDDAVWWLDNGAHNFPDGMTMLGNAGSAGPVRLWRATEEGTLDSVEVCGSGAGAVTNPPLVDDGRRIVVGYDSANGVMSAFDSVTLAPLWSRALRTSQHLVLYPDTGEVVANDHDPGAGDALVVVDITSGDVAARVPVDSPAQSVVFGCPGLYDDFIYVSLSSVARVVFDR